MALSIFSLLTMAFVPKIEKGNEPVESIYQISINALDGENLDLSKLKGKKILFVNVASKCGFTPQYEGLQKLHEMHGDKVAIVGVPCNQFASQEPGDSEEIASFCQKNYGVSFQMTEKVDVKGDDQHPLYTWLTSKTLNGTEDSNVKWNFQKYLIDETGKLIGVFSSREKPLSDAIISKI